MNPVLQCTTVPASASDTGTPLLINCRIHLLAFNSAAQANIIFAVKTGKILLANKAACKLLGYSLKKILLQSRATIFNIHETSFKQLLKQRGIEGESRGFGTAIKQTGKLIPCEITSAVFMNEEGIENSITTIVDISERIRKEYTDTKKEHDHVEQLQTKLNLQIKLKDKQIAEAKDEERSEIGKELHDNVNQLLCASTLYLGMAQKGGKERDLYVRRSAEYTLTAIQEIRKLSKTLTADISQHLGLSASIHTIIKDMMEVQKLKVTCLLRNIKEEGISEKIKLNIFRIVQEQLTNIVKYAHAKKASISLTQNKKSISLTINDNGIGFDTSSPQTGIGLANIKCRVLALKGTVEIISTPNQGCKVIARIPNEN